MGISFEILIGLCLLVCMLAQKELFYITFPKQDFILFLRPFNEDPNLIDKEAIDKEISRHFSQKIFAIADPCSLEGNENFIGYQLFLPTRAWKKELTYYIQKARYVFCNIGASEGVQWEMFEHSDMLTKYIFYIYEMEYVREYLTIYNKTKNYEETKLMYCLQKLLDISGRGKMFFIIESNTCYYSTSLWHIASYLNGQSIKDGLNKIEICTKDECDELSIDGKKRGETDSIVRFLRKLLSAIKELFQLFVTFFSFRKLASLLAIIIMILAVILCAAIFITGVCTWASIPFPSIGEGWCDDFSLIEKIMVGLFGISFGGVGLDKIKEKIFG